MASIDARGNTQLNNALVLAQGTDDQGPDNITKLNKKAARAEGERSCMPVPASEAVTLQYSML